MKQSKNQQRIKQFLKRRNCFAKQLQYDLVIVEDQQTYGCYVAYVLKQHTYVNMHKSVPYWIVSHRFFDRLEAIRFCNKLKQQRIEINEPKIQYFVNEISKINKETT
jgi:hypothetical protein